jgi:hypothetical protein
MEKLPSGGLAPPAEFFEVVGALALTEEELRKIKLPVTILVGDRDFARGLYVRPLQKIHKDWPVVEIKDADHVTCILKPQFRDGIVSWVKKNSE